MEPELSGAQVMLEYPAAGKSAASCWTAATETPTAESRIVAHMPLDAPPVTFHAHAAAKESLNFAMQRLATSARGIWACVVTPVGPTATDGVVPEAVTPMPCVL